LCEHRRGYEFAFEDERVAGETHNFKVTTLIGSILWALKGTTKVKGRVIDELDIDIGRLVILTVLVGTTVSEIGSPR
jgi:hypothetical protein